MAKLVGVFVVSSALFLLRFSFPHRVVAHLLSVCPVLAAPTRQKFGGKAHLSIINVIPTSNVKLTKNVMRVNHSCSKPSIIAININPLRV